MEPACAVAGALWANAFVNMRQPIAAVTHDRVNRTRCRWRLRNESDFMTVAGLYDD
jgi:hypothetical protein